jgi:hypothetical protein
MNEATQICLEDPMLRLVPTLALSCAVLGSTGAGLAADLDSFGTMRGSYEGYDEQSPLSIETGLRYWSSIGGQSFTVKPDTLNADDQTQFAEAHFRIDDLSTNTFVKGLAGYSVAINGSYAQDFYGYPPVSGAIVDGHIGYAGADFGYLMLGNRDNGLGFGGIVGYQYWNDSPNVGRFNYTTANSSSDVDWSASNVFDGLGYASEPNNIDIHALRLGLSGRVEFSDFFDIDAEVAAVPYAWVNGTLGAHGIGPLTNPNEVSSSVTTFSGHGYGAMAQIMFGINPSENLAFRLGGRAWYLQGNMDATFDTATLNTANQSLSQTHWISTSNPFSVFRYGLLGELTYKF